MALTSGIEGVPYETIRTAASHKRLKRSEDNLPDGFLPPKFWGLDPVFNTLPKFYIGDILAMPELDAHPGVFAYKNHPITKVDILGKIAEIEARGNKLFTYYVDDGTGTIACACFKPDMKDTTELVSTTTRLGAKLTSLLEDKDKATRPFERGATLSVHGYLQTYAGVRQVKAFHYAVVDNAMATTYRALQCVNLYQLYDRPFTLPPLLAKDVANKQHVISELAKK